MIKELTQLHIIEQGQEREGGWGERQGKEERETESKRETHNHKGNDDNSAHSLQRRFL